MIHFTELELEFFEKIGINSDNLKTRWEWVDERKALIFYRDFIYPLFNRVPKREEIDLIGYRGFRNAIKRIGLTPNDIVKQLGFKPNFEFKYIGMEFQDLVNFFIMKIYPDLKKKLKIKNHQPPTKEQLETNGYRGFTDRLYKLDYHYEDLLRTAGFTPFKEFKYKGKSYQDLIKMFNDFIYPNLIKDKIIIEGEVPVKQQVKDNGYSGFIQAIRRRGKTWGNLLKDAGYTPKLEYIYEKKNYQELLNYFIKVIYPNIKNKYSIKNDKAPLYDHIEKHYRGFLTAINRYDKKYSDLLLDAGFELNYGKYSEIRNFSDLVNIFSKEIYPDVIKRLKSNNVNLNEKEAPTVSTLREFGYNGFISRVYYLSNYIELVTAAGFLPNVEFKYKGKSYQELIFLFLNEIYLDIKSKISLKKYEAPNTLELCESGYSGLLDALYRIKKTYTDLVRDAGLEPRQKIESLVGTKLHPILELLFVNFMNKYNCSSYFEISPNLSSLRRVDNSVVRDANFKKFIETRQHIVKMPEIIQIINVDYTIGSMKRKIKSKLNKGYQGKEKLLIIVYLGNSQKKFQIPNEIPYAKHIRILNKEEFAHFVGYSRNALAEYNYIVNLARDACFIPQAYEELKNKSKKARKELKKYTKQQEAYISFMKNNGLDDLLREEISDISLDKWLTDESKEESELEESKDTDHTMESFKDKNLDDIVKDSNLEHPYDRRFSEIENDDYYYDQYLWLSPDVRENIENKTEELLNKAREGIDRNIDFSSTNDAHESPYLAPESIPDKESEAISDTESEVAPEVERDDTSELDPGEISEVEADDISEFEPEEDHLEPEDIAELEPDEEEYLGPDDITEPVPGEENYLEPEDISELEPEEDYYLEPDETPDAEPDDISDLDPDEAPDTETDDISDLEPDEVPDTEPDNISDPEPDETPQTESDNISDLEPDETPQTESDNISDLEPDEVSDTETDDISDFDPDESPDTEHDDISDTETDEFPDTETDDISDLDPDEVPDNETDDVSDLDPDEVPDSEHDDISDLDPDEAPETEHDDISDLDPEEIPDTGPEGMSEPGDPWQPTDMSPDVISGIVSGMGGESCPELGSPVPIQAEESHQNSETEREDFYDDFDTIVDDVSSEEDDTDDDIGTIVDNWDDIHEPDYIFDETSSDDLDGDTAGSFDEPINYVNVEDISSETAYYSSASYSDCPNDCPDDYSGE
ncbi:MAG: hypothetical protein ACFFG0_05895 [Candidatus Thorarchaeota archaeon]